MGVVGGDFLLRKTLKKVEKRSCFEICWGLGAISNTSPTFGMQLPTLLGKTCMYLLPNRANLGSCTQGNRSSNMRFANEWWPPLTLPKSNIMIVDAILVPNNRAVSTIVREVLVADNNVSSTLGPTKLSTQIVKENIGFVKNFGVWISDFWGSF